MLVTIQRSTRRLSIILDKFCLPPYMEDASQAANQPYQNENKMNILMQRSLVILQALTNNIHHLAFSRPMAEREGGVVKQGHEEGLKMAATLLEEFGLPMGLLPLADVIEVGFVKSTGYMWILQKKKVEHNFKMIKKLVSYDTEITGYVSKKVIKKLKGVKAKELMLWPPVSEIIVDHPPSGKIHFKSLAGITKTFPVEAFAAGQ